MRPVDTVAHLNAADPPDPRQTLSLGISKCEAVIINWKTSRLTLKWFQLTWRSRHTSKQIQTDGNRLIEFDEFHSSKRERFDSALIALWERFAVCLIVRRLPDSGIQRDQPIEPSNLKWGRYLILWISPNWNHLKSLETIRNHNICKKTWKWTLERVTEKVQLNL